MKKKLIITSLMALVITISAFASAALPINGKAEENFTKQFRQATNVSWSKSGDKEKVSFMLNDRMVHAFYAQDGTLVSVSRNILSTELPLSLSIDLKKNYQDYWITNLNEIAGEDGTIYYVTLENTCQQLVLKSTNISDWIVFQKFKKY